MSKENAAFITFLRKIIREEFWQLLDEDILPVLRDYVGVRLDSSKTNSADVLAESLVNILKTSSSKGKESLNSKTREKPWNWDPQKIAWTKAQGTKGEYERSEDVNSPDFRNLLEDLSAHQGTLQRDSLFYWTFPNGSTIGRKQRG